MRTTLSLLLYSTYSITPPKSKRKLSLPEDGPPDPKTPKIDDVPAVPDRRISPRKPTTPKKYC